MISHLREWHPGILAKLMIVAALVLTVVITLVEVISYSSARHQIIELSEERQLTLTSEYADHLDRMIEDIERDLDQIHDLPVLREYFYNRQYTLDEEAHQYLQDIARYWLKLYARRPAYELLQLLDPGGNEILSLTHGSLHFGGGGEQRSGLPLHSLPRGIPAGRTTDEGLEWSKRIEGYSLVFRRPIVIDERYWGDVRVHSDLQPLLARIRQEQLFETGHLAIYDTRGSIVYDPRHETGAPLSESHPRIADRLGSFAGNPTQTIVGSDGVKRLVSVSQMLKKPWAIAAIVPEAEALARTNRTRDLIILVAVLGLLLEFVVLAFFTRHLIVAPVHRLLESTKRILQGGYGHKVEIASRDEFGALAATFNAMSQSLDLSVGEMRSREREIESLNVSLQQKVEQLQKEIEERLNAEAALRVQDEKLRHAEKMESIGHLAGGVAHEFNNLLAGIMGYSELLKQDLEGQSALVEHTDVILAASRQAAELTSQLLAFSRRGSLRIEALDLNSLIREVSRLVEHTVDRRIDISFEFESEKAMIKGDQSRIQSALLNLAINARDAMPEGGTLGFRTSTIALDAEACLRSAGSLKAGRHVVLEVYDTGCGIRPEDLAYVFEPFFTTKDLGRGTGIGLAAVYGTVQSHEGAIEVESSMGKGTTIRITLPSSTEAAKTSSLETSSLRKGHGLVLVVDDEEKLRTLHTLSLERLGYQALCAEDGVQALEIYSKHGESIDLVLLDVVMPRMGGRETLRVLRQIDPDAKVILCTGFDLEGKDWHTPELGIQDVLYKPFGLAELSRTLERVMNDAVTEGRQAPSHPPSK